MKILNEVKSWIQQKVNPLHLQIAGYAATWLAYVILIICELKGVKLTDNLGHVIWGMLLVFAGIPELLLILVWDTTITRFGRGLLKKTIDVILMIGLIFVTWAVFGPVIAAIGFVHFLSCHYGDKQYD